jgi:hypothetical protein
MTNRVNAHVGCQLVGEYVDEAELPTNLATHRSEIVRPHVVGEYRDLWGRDDGIKEFTVLLKDGRVVAVRGHGLKQLPPTTTGESGSYGVIVRTEAEEVFVALFKMLDVVGIFHGEMRSDRKSA